MASNTVLVAGPVSQSMCISCACESPMCVWISWWSNSPGTSCTFKGILPLNCSYASGLQVNALLWSMLPVQTSGSPGDLRCHASNPNTLCLGYSADSSLSVSPASTPNCATRPVVTGAVCEMLARCSYLSPWYTAIGVCWAWYSVHSWYACCWACACAPVNVLLVSMCVSFLFVVGLWLL